MSLSQQIRDAMRQMGASVSCADIADQIGADRTAVSGQLNAFETRDIVICDRTERPFRYTLDEKRAKEVEEHPVAQAAAAAAGEPKVRKTRIANRADVKPVKKPGKKKLEHKARTTRPAQTPPTPTPTVAPRGSTVPLDRHLAVRLCVLALNSLDELTAGDRLDIATVIKAAA